MSQKQQQQQQQQTPHLHQTNSSQSASASAQEVIYEEPYEKHELTLKTPVKNLEVLSEIMIDFENLKENGFDFLSDVKIQGWEKYFDHLHGPVFFT